MVTETLPHASKGKAVKSGQFHNLGYEERLCSEESSRADYTQKLNLILNYSSRSGDILIKAVVDIKLAGIT